MKPPAKQSSKYPTEWDLVKFFYKNAAKPAIEKDLVVVEKAYKTFGDTYRTADFTKDPETLRKALEAYEKFLAVVSAAKPALYFNYRRALNSADTEAEAALNVIVERLTSVGNEI